jgi:pimeloyl-ACP methyl ester carboxylesterase
LLTAASVTCVLLRVGPADAQASWPSIDLSATVMQPYDLSNWPGMTILKGGKGYANTPWGQVHYRDVGPRGPTPPLFLMHQSPFSMAEFQPIQDDLAAAGLRSIAVDLPGYGMSDEPQAQPTIADYARTMLAVLDVLELPKVILVGHHTGASIAAAMAARYPERVVAVVLHGAPYYSPQESAALLASRLHPRELEVDGSHLTSFFDVASGGPQNKSRSPGQVVNATWAVLGYFSQGRDYGHIAAFSNDMGADLRRIAAPTLVLSDPVMLHDNDVAAARLRPNFSLVVLPHASGNPLVELAPLWTKTVKEFVEAAGAMGEQKR